MSKCGLDECGRDASRWQIALEELDVPQDAVNGERFSPVLACSREHAREVVVRFLPKIKTTGKRLFFY